MWWITASCLLVKRICNHLKVTRSLVDVWQAAETSHSKSSLGNFHYQYMAELLVNVYSYCLMVKCVLLLCVWKPGFLKSGHNLSLISSILVYTKAVLIRILFLNWYWKLQMDKRMNTVIVVWVIANHLSMLKQWNLWNNRSMIIAIARGGHGWTFSPPWLNFALSSKPSSYLNCT